MHPSDVEAARATPVLSQPHETWPCVSVIIPVLNEERYIAECLRGVLAQDYPADKMEIVVVDGMSTDRTREIVQAMADDDKRIRLLLSPKRRTPFSMNIGLAAATGEVVVRIDGHSEITPDHVRKSVDFLFRSGAEHIGGVMRATGRTYAQKAIALAMSSPFGVGTARFRYTNREEEIDTVPFGAFRRETLLRLGGFDERFVIGQDSEFDHRIILSGGRVVVTPEIHTDYYCRDSLKRLSIQYFRYGKAKARILHKHGSLPSPRAVAPAALVSAIALLTIAAPFSRAARKGLQALLTIYVLGNVGGSSAIAAKGGWRYAPFLPTVLATLHLSHGAGFLAGLPLFLTPRPVDSMRGSLTTDGEGLAASSAWDHVGAAS